MDFDKLIRYRNEKNPFSRRLGVTVDHVSLGRARAVMTVGPEDANPLGYAHGGVYFTLADIACGTAASTHGYQAVTVNGSCNFFRSASPGDVLSAEASEVKYGRTISVYDVRMTDQRGQLLGSGTFTFYLLDKKLEL